MKKCTQCGEEKQNEDFPKRKTNKDGLYSWCKKCCIKKTKIHAALYPEKVKASREKRRDKSIESCRKYKEDHKEKIKKYTKIYYALNREKLIKKSKKEAKNLTKEQKERKKEYYLRWKKSDSAKIYRDSIYEERKERYGKQKKASRFVTNAVRDGRLKKPENCQFCMSNEKIEGHHPNYEKPLEVIWLCRKCHRALHKSLKDR